MVDAARPGSDVTRVLLVDDHDLFRTGLATLLEEQGIAVVGQAANGADAVRGAASSRPTSS